jgi:hypothetical protein
MSILSDVKNAVVGLFAKGPIPSEADVINFLAKLHDDADLAYDWVATNGPTIVKDIQIVMGIVVALGSGNPTVASAVVAVNVFTAALNALVAAKGANEDIFHAVNDAYQALKKMQVASAQAVLAVA